MTGRSKRAMKGGSTNQCGHDVIATTFMISDYREWPDIVQLSLAQAIEKSAKMTKCRVAVNPFVVTKNDTSYELKFTMNIPNTHTFSKVRFENITQYVVDSIIQHLLSEAPHNASAVDALQRVMDSAIQRYFDPLSNIRSEPPSHEALHELMQEMVVLSNSTLVFEIIENHMVVTEKERTLANVSMEQTSDPLNYAIWRGIIRAAVLSHVCNRDSQPLSLL